MYHFYTFYSWYCHLDDDMYVNTEQLGKILLSRDHNEEHYLGRNYYTNQFTVPQHTLRHYPSGLIVSLINCIVFLLSNYNDIMMSVTLRPNFKASSYISASNITQLLDIIIMARVLYQIYSLNTMI